MTLANLANLAGLAAPVLGDGVVQHGRISGVIFSVPRPVAELSAVLPLTARSHQGRFVRSRVAAELHRAGVRIPHVQPEAVPGGTEADHGAFEDGAT